MYVEPYKTVDLRDVAQAFGQTLEVIESDIADLITDIDNPLRAKIDSFKKILYSRKQNTQIKMYQNAQALGKQYIDDTENMLLKVAVIQNKFILMPEMSKREMQMAQMMNM